MGLADKAQQRKQILDSKEDSDKFVVKKKKLENRQKEFGLLQKAEKRKRDLLEKTGIKTIKTFIQKKIKKESTDDFSKAGLASMGQRDVLDEVTGFGWKGLGSRRIIFDSVLNQYSYEVIEPRLDDDEKRIKDKLIHLFRIRTDVDVFGLDSDGKIKRLEEVLEKIIVDNNVWVKDESKDKIFYYIIQEFVGLGKIDVLMYDEDIEDISCDGHNVPIFIHHRKYESITTNVIFNNADELNSFVVKLAQICDKQISVYEPIIDGRFPDGARLQLTLAKTVTASSTFTIRRFREDPITPVDLVNYGTISIDIAAYLWLAIENGTSILFCGGTASGKTSALNAFSLFIPASYKIVSIEDTREINLPHKNWIAGTTRTGFSTSEKDKGGRDIDMFDLIRAALRQRPRVIIVGEVRGKEAYSLFQAMATGHFSYSTAHANDLHDLIQRLENPPISLPRALFTSLDVVVFLNSVTVNGKPVRRVTKVIEIIKLDPSTNRLITITPFTWSSEVDDRFESKAKSKILQKIKKKKGWDEERLHQELENRKKVMEWLIRENLRSYKDVGKIVSKYSSKPKEVLKKAMEPPK